MTSRLNKKNYKRDTQLLHSATSKQLSRAVRSPLLQWSFEQTSHSSSLNVEFCIVSQPSALAQSLYMKSRCSSVTNQRIIFQSRWPGVYTTTCTYRLSLSLLCKICRLGSSFSRQRCRSRRSRVCPCAPNSCNTFVRRWAPASRQTLALQSTLNNCFWQPFFCWRSRVADEKNHFCFAKANYVFTGCMLWPIINNKTRWWLKISLKNQLNQCQFLDMRELNTSCLIWIIKTIQISGCLGMSKF